MQRLIYKPALPGLWLFFNSLELWEVMIRMLALSLIIEIIYTAYTEKHTCVKTRNFIFTWNLSLFFLDTVPSPIVTL